METKAKFLTTKQMTLIALMTALTCILGPLSIPLPFSPVPISFTNLVLYFSVFVLGTKFSTISYIVYLLIGLVGLPVFSGFSGGPAKVAGPTGGYLVGFVFLTVIAGFFVEHFKGKLSFAVLGMVLGPIAESNLRNALVMSNGSWTILVKRPICLAFIILTFVLIVLLKKGDAKQRKATDKYMKGEQEE